MGLINKHQCQLLLLFILALPRAQVIRAADAIATTVETDEIQLMVVAARTNNLAGFMEVAGQKSWRCPVIFSSWYQRNRVPANDARALHEVTLARDLGKELLVKVDAISPSVSDETDRNLNRARLLLDFAEWACRMGGYGNFSLGSHARDLAVCGLAYCVVDLRCDLKGIGDLIARCHLPSDDPKTCAQVLNNELGYEVFTPSPFKSAAAVSTEMEQTWHYYAQASKIGMPDESAMRYVEEYKLRSNVISQASGFFKDDSTADALTTLSRWDKKEHAAFLAGLNNDRLSYLETLFLFRQTIGNFPTVTTQKNHPFGSDQKAAFWEAWVKHPQGNRDGKVGLAAYSAYRQITEGRFLDPDRERVYLHGLRHPAK